MQEYILRIKSIHIWTTWLYIIRKPWLWLMPGLRHPFYTRFWGLQDLSHYQLVSSGKDFLKPNYNIYQTYCTSMCVPCTVQYFFIYHMVENYFHFNETILWYFNHILTLYWSCEFSSLEKDTIFSCTCTVLFKIAGKCW